MTTQWEYHIETVTRPRAPDIRTRPAYRLETGTTHGPTDEREPPPEPRRQPETQALWLARLNELGSAGWELITVRRAEDGSWFEGTFKRPKAVE